MRLRQELEEKPISQISWAGRREKRSPCVVNAQSRPCRNPAQSGVRESTSCPSANARPCLAQHTYAVHKHCSRSQLASDVTGPMRFINTVHWPSTHAVHKHCSRSHGSGECRHKRPPPPHYGQSSFCPVLI